METQQQGLALGPVLENGSLAPYKLGKQSPRRVGNLIFRNLISIRDHCGESMGHEHLECFSRKTIWSDNFFWGE